MTQRQMAYDDPAYRSPVFFSSAIPAALNSTTATKFVAYTTMLVKSCTVLATVMGTCGGTDIANGALYAVKISGTNTSTFAHTTWGTTGQGATIGTYTATTTTWPAANGTLNAGDVLYARKGTDSTLQAVVAFEMYVAPGANLTV